MRARLSAFLGPYASPRVAAMLVLGFSSGLPFLLVLGTLQLWLAEAGISRAHIGFAVWVGLAYGFKFLWAPLVDRLRLPLLTRLFGQRRGWLLLSQAAIMLGLLGMASTDPAQDFPRMIGFALVVAFSSATQDIALDAWRIEAVELARQGAMAAAYQAGYRIALLVAGAGALWIAAAFDASEASYEPEPWWIAYRIMAALMATGVVTTLLVAEPAPRIPASTQARLAARFSGPLLTALTWLKEAVLSPFVDFFVRFRWQAALILALIALYRISDVVMGSMSMVFYHDMGFSKEEIATVTKVYGVFLTLTGAALGGWLVARAGIARTLFLGAATSAATNLLFVWLAGRPHDLTALVVAVSADNLAAGLATSAFVAYLSSLVNHAYSATQYALFSSVMVLLPKFLAGFSGQVVDHYGWPFFFTGTALLGVPVLILVWLARRVGRNGDA